jgi:hypothetical protein
MNAGLDARSVSHFFYASVLPILSLFVVGGCAAGNSSQLEVRGDPRGPKGFQFREINWRPSRDGGGGVEMIGYGLVPFFNDPSARGWDPRWPRSGFVTMPLRVTPQPDGRYEIKILGPSTSLGPGDDEVLTAVAENAHVEAGDGDTRTLRLADAPTQSRNRPGLKLSMSGDIVATSTSDDHFERELRQFETELSFRGPVRP